MACSPIGDAMDRRETFRCKRGDLNDSFLSMIGDAMDRSESVRLKRSDLLNDTFVCSSR